MDNELQKPMNNDNDNSGIENIKTGDVISNYQSDEDYSLALNTITKEVEKYSEDVKTTSDFNEFKQSLSDAKDKLKGLFLKEEDNNRLIEIINNSMKILLDRQSEIIEKLNQENNENYQKIKPLVDEVLEGVNKVDTDFKKSKDQLIDVQDKLQKLKLRKSQRDELLNLVRDAFETLTNKQIEERENYEMETIENFHTLKVVVEKAVQFADKSTKYGKARETLIDAQNQIKDKKLKRDQKDKLFDDIREAFNRLNVRQESEREVFEEEAKINYTNLKKIVDDACNFAKDSNDFKESRRLLIDSQATIKGLKLKRAQRDELYAQIREVFDDLNKRQEEDREVFEKESKDNYENLTNKINHAFELVHGVDDLNMIRDTLVAIQGEIKILKLKRTNRNELFARVREAFGLFDKKKDEFYAKRHTEKKDKLAAIKDNLENKIERINEAINRDKESLEFQNKKLEKVKAGEISDDSEEEVNKVIKMIADRIAEREVTLNETKVRLEDLDKELSD